MQTVLVIGHVWVAPKASAAGTRLLQLIKLFQSNNFKVVFACAATKLDIGFDLNSIGVEIVNIELNNSSFDIFINKLNPSIVLFDRYITEEQYGWRVSENCPSSLQILDTQDLHFLRAAREKAFKNNTTVDDNFLLNDITKREIASILRCDLSLIISEYEVELLQQKFNISKSILHYIPFVFKKETYQSNRFPSFNTRKHFITVGNFLHAPNYQSVLYLKQTIWPLIKKQLPKAQLHIYGAFPSEKINQLHNTTTGFIIKGYIDAIDIAMQQAKLCLAPLQFGAGLKGKLFTAMQNGTPFITTPTGAEGIFNTTKNYNFINDNAKAFSNQAVAYYGIKTKWQDAQQVGFNILKQFTATNFEQDFINKLKHLQANLKQHRANNFLGEILKHHSLQSTKYLSKWIEEKNRLP